MKIRHSVLFNPGGPCTCSTTDDVRAFLEGKTRPPCPTHQQTEIDRLEREAEQDAIRAAADHEVDVLTQAVSDIRARDELAAARERREAREAEIDGIADPLLRSLYLVTGSEAPVNAPSQFPSLTGFTGDDAA